MIIRPSDIHKETARARLGIGLAADTLGVECDLRLSSQWLVKIDDKERTAFLELARECAEKGEGVRETRRVAMFKVTWTTSRRTHATVDGKTTICGHDFSGGPENVHSVHGTLHKHKKRHCRTCFVKKPDFKSPWLPSCE